MDVFSPRKILNYRYSRQISSAFIILLIVVFYISSRQSALTDTNFEPDVRVYADGREFVYNRNSPLFFIGGFPRSGTTLMRAMLDAHPDVRCGQETRIIPRILNFKKGIYNPLEKKRMAEGGVSEDVLDSAMRAFLLEVIVRHGEPASHLCTKDPFVMLSAHYVSKLFPFAKFLFMVRDGRASVYSAITRNVTIAGFNMTSPRACLKKWSSNVAAMHQECDSLAGRCMLVHYEQLVLHPAHWLHRIIAFLGLPWHEAVLNHDQLINQRGGVPLSRLEKSSDQVIKPVNVAALARWVGFYEQDVVRDMARIAPMLQELGYDPEANPPDYGTPDDSVAQNTRLVFMRDRVGYWNRRAKQLYLNRKGSM